MEDNLNRDPNFDEAHKDPRQGNPQKDQEQQQEKGQQENKDKDQNKNFDLAQRRQQASPRSYNESLDSENIENQNTEAHREQTDRPVGTENREDQDKDEKSGKKMGDKLSERQQTIDEKDKQRDKGRTEGNP